MVKLPDLWYRTFKNSRNAQLAQDILPENVSVLVLVEGTLQPRGWWRHKNGSKRVSILVLVEGTLQWVKYFPYLANN